MQKISDSNTYLIWRSFSLWQFYNGVFSLKKKKKGKQLVSKADGVRYYTEDGIMEVSSLD